MSSHGSSNTGSKTSTGTASSITTPANAGIGGDKPKVFDEQGAIGKQFTEKGALGGAAQAIGALWTKKARLASSSPPRAASVAQCKTL
ncbi:hypothetical protein DL769_000509 [Monosporascus sp. CRB-8-3]|nr:hypothetical protein DL769_000509 [Monosporascus sp. CRB-8-3]